MKPINPKGEQREVKLTLDVEAAELLLRLAGSSRKQGEYVSNLIRQAAKQTNFAELEDLEEGDVAPTRSQMQRMRRELLARIKALEENVTELKAQNK